MCKYKEGIRGVFHQQGIRPLLGRDDPKSTTGIPREARDTRKSHGTCPRDPRVLLLPNNPWDAFLLF